MAETTVETKYSMPNPHRIREAEAAERKKAAENNSFLGVARRVLEKINEYNPVGIGMDYIEKNCPEAMDAIVYGTPIGRTCATVEKGGKALGAAAKTSIGQRVVQGTKNAWGKIKGVFSKSPNPEEYARATLIQQLRAGDFKAVQTAVKKGAVTEAEYVLDAENFVKHKAGKPFQLTSKVEQTRLMEATQNAPKALKFDDKGTLLLNGEPYTGAAQTSWFHGGAHDFYNRWGLYENGKCTAYFTDYVPGTYY